MRISLAFASVGSTRRAASLPAPPLQRKQRPHASRVREHTSDNVGLEALGQVLAEPRGFLDRSNAVGASDSLDGISGRARSRACSGLPAARSVAKPGARGTIAGAFEAAIALVLLAARSTFTGYPIPPAAATPALVPAMTRPANAHVTEAITAGGARTVVETTIRRWEP